MTRTALVTGGSGGIGEACARELANRDYDLILVARREEPLARVAQDIGARYVVADVSDAESFGSAMSSIEHVDLVVHAAGVLSGTYARKQTMEQWHSLIAGNLDSCFVLTATVLPLMTPGGRLIFISSSAAHTPMRARTAYSATKAGVTAFAGALSLEVDRDGISVHVVTPAQVETPMLEDPPFEMDALLPSDVADTVAWLDTLPPHVILDEIRMSAVSRGPFRRPPILPRDPARWRTPPS